MFKVDGVSVELDPQYVKEVKGDTTDTEQTTTEEITTAPSSDT